MTTVTSPVMATETIVECPQCGKRGKTVRPVTLRALLKQQYAADVYIPEEPNCEAGCTPSKGNTGWRFCNAPDCDVVYFSETGKRTSWKSHLRVPVGIKEKTGARPLCYCFGHSVASIKEELRSKGRSDALDDIRAKMKDPGCRCETENPSGSCCLGSVTKGIQVAEEELGMNLSNVETQTSPAKTLASRGETIAKVGAIVSAIVASSCCWLPLVLLAVGMSAAGIAATLETYRPLFILATFGLLAAAFYFTYRPNKCAADGAHASCVADRVDDDECCAAASNRRVNRMTMNKMMLWVVTALAVAFLLFPRYVGTLMGSSDPAAITANMNQAVFKVEGMTCEGCAATVARAIKGVPGVGAVSVNYERKEAIVGTDACCPVPKDKIRAALEQAGYTSSFVE